MTTFKCKMCGGALEIENQESVARCEYCGTMQTLPKLDNEKIANLYDRANHFRRNNEFDKAGSIYEQILTENPNDAEAYWSLVLSRYGIEYVEDPATHKRIPTVNRTQFTSIYDDDNYKSALHYADSYQRTIYEEEAKTINEIQKNILTISQQEEPFDIFICYKESDANGSRTPDSVLAQQLYYELQKEGFKVFFSRITLEDKLGSAYEPYIFAALNSAKIMIVLGTQTSYFNAVWVKNEWSRYLALIKSGAKKTLIPAYRDMDPYDLPDEFSHLQAQDMAKLGFMQDLIRGIHKLMPTEAPVVSPVGNEAVFSGETGNISPLIKRVFMFLEDQDWNSADEYCEKILDLDPENAQAYLGKLMVDLQVSRQEDLEKYPKTFEENNNFQKIMRFAEPELKETVVGYLEKIATRNESIRMEKLYQDTCARMERATTPNIYREAAESFLTIRDYKNAAELADQCLEMAEIVEKDHQLTKAKNMMEKSEATYYLDALKILETIPDWKDAQTCIIQCKDRILTETANRLNGIQPIPLTLALKYFQSIAGWRNADDFIVYCKDSILNQAQELIQSTNKKEFNKGIKLLESVSGWRNADALLEETKEQANINKKNAALDKAKELLNCPSLEDYPKILKLLDSVSGWKDADETKIRCMDVMLSRAKACMIGDNVSNYTIAYKLLKNIPGWKDADELLAVCKEKMPKEEKKEDPYGYPGQFQNPYGQPPYGNQPQYNQPPYGNQPQYNQPQYNQPPTTSGGSCLLWMILFIAIIIIFACLISTGNYSYGYRRYYYY